MLKKCLGEPTLQLSQPLSERNSASKSVCTSNKVRRRVLAHSKLDLTRWDRSVKGSPTREKILNQLKDEGYTFTTYTFPPGTVFGDHSHQCSKKDSIISGKFRFRMDGEEVILEAGDMLLVPKGKVHYAEVVGNSFCEFVDASKT